MENSRIEKAGENHYNGYNCAQALACAFSDEVGLDEKTIFNLISSMPITVEVHKGYVAFNRIDFTVYDTGIINSIAYVFQGMENVDTGYESIEIAPNWYYLYGEFSKGYFEEEQE